MEELAESAARKHGDHDDCDDDHHVDDYVADDENDDDDYDDENRSRGRRTSRGRVGHAGHTRLAYKVLSPTNTQIQSALANKYTNTKCSCQTNTQMQSVLADNYTKSSLQQIPTRI